MRVKDAVGRFGEQVATDYVLERGMQVLDRNWRCTGGELDLVARDGATLVFIEVKTRSSCAFGSPAEAVDARKAARIRRLAGQWITTQRETGGGSFWRAVRFDVIAVLRERVRGADPAVRVEHLVGVF